MLKKAVFVVALLALVALGGAVYIKNQVDQYASQPLVMENESLITVEPGTSFAGLLAKFEKAGWIKPTPFVRLVPKLHPELVNVKAGTFMLSPDKTLAEALSWLGQGKEHQFAITFVEGSRFSEWREQFAQTEHIAHDTTELSEAEIAARLGIEQERLEGLFLAETYHYTAGTSELEILKRANRKLKAELDAAWQGRQQKLPLKNPYEALILASIIEKETAIDSERERVASVFVNRLNRGMRLQTDPTVIYGMGDKYQGNIRKKDLRTPTPYNTYVIRGLPPTPIAMAGKASIEAALNPEESRYLYFVASGHGGHVFSKSLTEHNRAVREYLKVLRSNR